MTRKIDYEIMNRNVLVQSDSGSGASVHSSEVSPVQIMLKEIVPPEPEQTESVKVEALQPDYDEPKPNIPWLYGSPDQATLVRCCRITELSKELKNQKL